MSRTNPSNDALSKSKSRRLDEAVAFMERHPDMSARQTATIYQVHPSSISKRLSRQVKSFEVAAQEKQSLTPMEEEVLSKWVIQYWAWELPLQIRHLNEFALEILLRKRISNPVIGKNWHLALLRRNPTIKPKLSSPLDRSHIAACTPDNLKSFFDLYLKITHEKKIKKGNIHNMDEKGTLMGCMNLECILVPKEEKTAALSQDGSREWVSSLECICADGSSIDAFIVIKGVHFRQDLFDHATPNMTIASLEKGWTPKEIAMA